MAHPSPKLTHAGETLSVTEWAKRTGITSTTIRARLAMGWTVADALTRPVDKSKKPAKKLPNDGRRPVPAMREHSSGQACARWREGGRDRVKYFGAWGSAIAAAEYSRFVAAWAEGSELPTGPEGITVAKLGLRWLAWCESEYTKDGKPTSEVSLVRLVLKPLNEVAGVRPANEFTPKDLKAIQAKLVAEGYVRTTVNSAVQRIVRLFRWGVSEELVRADVWQALTSVRGLKSGRGAEENSPRTAVPDEHVEAVLNPGMIRGEPSTVAAMIRVQRLTGMRPGEVCGLKLVEIDRSADVWVYTPPGHKTRHTGAKRRVHLGPRAQSIITPFIKAAATPEDRLFGITRGGYCCAVRAACARAGVPRWTPHQLRHSLATEVARRYSSLATAAAAIGDSPATAARHYVHVDPDERAKIDVARDMG